MQTKKKLREKCNDFGLILYFTIFLYNVFISLFIPKKLRKKIIFL